MSAYPIPASALDDRLGFIGTSGSGKTYNAGAAVERLLQTRARVVIVDPLGVWWGLRLLADGKTPSPFNVAIFGGPHGDLPLNEHAGALIGETVATMAESGIVDLSQLGTKSAERRFMTGFLNEIYRKAPGEPFHLVIDEADLFAPQRPPKGDETLLNLTEQIVRRGRVKGFIPWLISQRPAVLNKNVLSQVDGLIAFKLTSTQDRDALDGWIEGQADKAEGKAIKDHLPAMPLGRGIVWLPGHSVLEDCAFPLKSTFDSSRTPKRGEKAQPAATLKALDLGKLLDRLSAVEAETKANDPKTLRARIAQLEKELRSQKPDDAAAIDKAYQSGHTAGSAEAIVPYAEKLRELEAAIRTAAGYLVPFIEAEDGGVPVLDIRRVPPPPTIEAPRRAIAKPVVADIANPKPTDVTQGITKPQQRILDALAWWRAAGIPAPMRIQVAMVAAYRPSSGGFNNLLGSMRSAGLIDYPGTGRVVLSAEGSLHANAPMAATTTSTLHDQVRAVLSTPQWRVLSALLKAYPQEIGRDALGEATEYSPTSGGFNNLLGSLRSLGLIDYPNHGMVRAEDILFIPDRRAA